MIGRVERPVHQVRGINDEGLARECIVFGVEDSGVLEEKRSAFIHGRLAFMLRCASVKALIRELKVLLCYALLLIYEGMMLNSVPYKTKHREPHCHIAIRLDFSCKSRGRVDVRWY
jgi:hypothetical protein